MLVKQQGSGTIGSEVEFRGADPPARSACRSKVQPRSAPRSASISSPPNLADEVISSGDYQWRDGGAVYTTQKVYPKLAKIVVKNLGDDDTVTVKTLDFTTERPHALHAVMGGRARRGTRADHDRTCAIGFEAIQPCHLGSPPARPRFARTGG
ncbi:MAG: hypothetical protein M0C28_33595 [Candidatus Moduliflexus flocculans]|nr:hypothetical protein [Candidatus Moduliflexus flocculans]